MAEAEEEQGYSYGSAKCINVQSAFTISETHFTLYTARNKKRQNQYRGERNCQSMVIRPGQCF